MTRIWDEANRRLSAEKPDASECRVQPCIGGCAGASETRRVPVRCLGFRARAQGPLNTVRNVCPHPLVSFSMEGTRRLVAALLVAATSRANPGLPTDQIRQFLKTADIVASEPIGAGTTGAWRLTLSDGRIAHDAAFQSVDLPLRRPGEDGRPIVDSFHHSIAAYRLAELVGLAEMMPVTVERTWRGRPGALSWWIDDVAFDEEARSEAREYPSDLDAWGAQIDRMWLFAELVHDTDRHQGNLLYTQDWRLYMVDFTRAFGISRELMKPYRLLSVDKGLLSRLEQLTIPTVTAATAPHLSGEQVAAVLGRRDMLVAHFESLSP